MSDAAPCIISDPAFPVSTQFNNGEYGHQDSHNTFQFPGISIRDYFAAKAMQGMIASGNFEALEVACYAYRVADAMLNVRASS